MIDQSDFEAEAIATAAADLGDRFAGVTILKTGNVGKTEPSRDTLQRLIPRTGLRIDRRDLTGSGEIIERMAHDILAARRQGDHGILVDLTEYGWSTAQAARFGSSAHARATSPDFICQDAVERATEADDQRPTPATADMVTMLDDIRSRRVTHSEGGDAA